MEKPIIKPVHELKPGDEFIHSGSSWRVLTELKYTVVDKGRAIHKREVMNTVTGKTKRLPYFENVHVTGNFYSK